VDVGEEGGLVGAFIEEVLRADVLLGLGGVALEEHVGGVVLEGLADLGKDAACGGAHH